MPTNDIPAIQRYITVPFLPSEARSAGNKVCRFCGIGKREQENSDSACHSRSSSLQLLAPLFFLESEQLRTRQEYHNRIREATLSRIDILSSNQSAGMSTPSIHDLARKGNYDSFLVGLSLPECVPSMKRIHYF
jgi:hypothetical protein